MSYVTPLGIRQQYMIGNELRYRYVQEVSGFMDDKYNITQPFIQSSWNDTAILSAQAMMLGIYPPGENNYVITEEQKYNAVPPIDGFDFKPWIDEMGEGPGPQPALPHQTTIFPIQMNGWSYDYMLAIDDGNCPTLKSEKAKIAAEIKQLDDDAITNSGMSDAEKSAMRGLIGQSTFVEFCDYISWAYTESIQLKSSIGVSIEKLFTTCASGLKQNSMRYAQLETDTLNGVSSNNLRQRLMFQSAYWLSKIVPANPTDPNYK